MASAWDPNSLLSHVHVQVGAIGNSCPVRTAIRPPLSPALPAVTLLPDVTGCPAQGRQRLRVGRYECRPGESTSLQKGARPQNSMVSAWKLYPDSQQPSWVPGLPECLRGPPTTRKRLEPQQSVLQAARPTLQREGKRFPHPTATVKQKPVFADQGAQHFGDINVRCSNGTCHKVVPAVYTWLPMDLPGTQSSHPARFAFYSTPPPP